MRLAAASELFVLSSFVMGACSPASAPSEPPAAAAGAPTPLVHTLTWQQDPGSEVVQCHTFKLGNATPLEIERIKFAFGSGSHHVHIYRSDEPADDGVTDCSAGISWPRWRLVVGAQTQPLDWQLPAGLTLPLAPNTQLLVQVHWLNTTAQPLDGRIDLSFYPARAPGSHVGVVFGIDKQVHMQPGERKRVSHFCALPAGSQVIAMMGHFHALGRAYGVWLRDADGSDDTGTQIYRGLDENTLTFESFAPPVGVGAGQGLEFQCDFTNSRDFPITWGPDTKTQEHCNMAAYYYPAVEDDDGFCIKEIDDVGTLVGLRASLPEISVGDSAELTVDAAAPVEADTDVVVTATDPSALDAPQVLRIPAHARSVTGTVRGRRPAAAAGLTATLGTQTASLALPVRGLLLSELLVRPSPDSDVGPWVEIANTTGRAIDLDPYRLSIGAGDSGGGVDVPLSGTLAPHGCLLVTAAAPPPVDTLVSMMMMSGLPSTLPSGQDGPVTVELRDADAALDLTSYGAAPPGTSMLRLGGDQWTEVLVPTPGICELRP